MESKRWETLAQWAAAAHPQLALQTEPVGQPLHSSADPTVRVKRRQHRPHRVSREDLRRLAEILSVTARRDRGLPDRFSIDDADECTSRAGVSLRWFSGPQEGRYARHGGEPVVELRSITRRPQRQTFVLAHELGHHFVEEVRSNSSFRRQIPERALQLLSLIDVAGPAEERLCDAFARALLLPADDMRSAVGQTVVNFHVLRPISLEWRVSVALVASRLFDLGLSHGMYLRGRIEGRKLAVVAWTWRGLEMSNPTELEVRHRPRQLDVGDHDLTAHLHAKETVLVAAQVRVRPDGKATAFLVPREEHTQPAAVTSGLRKVASAADRALRHIPGKPETHPR